MRFQWPFGKKHAARRHALRDELAESVDAYIVHIKRMFDLFETIEIDTRPAALDGNTRGAIVDKGEKDLPLLRTMLTEMQAAAPHRMIQIGHQQLLAGLQRMVDGQGKMLAAARADANPRAQTEYQDGLGALRDGAGEAGSAMQGMTGVLAKLRKLLR
jgi:hypothetical protein